MSLREITNKLARKNVRRNLLFCLSAVFATTMLGAHGVLQFSPTVTNVLSVTGSTYMISLGMYALALCGIAAFLIYANSVYLGNKMDELGILLSLGLRRKAVAGILSGEFSLLYGISTLVGLVLSVPVAWLCWSGLTLFISSSETAFTIGWPGLIIAFTFGLLMWPFLWLINKRRINKLDIIKIMKTSSEQERVAGDSIMLGVLGFIAIPLGLIIYRMSTLSDGLLRQISFVFILLSISGLYLLTVQITTIGNVFKRFWPGIYHKHLLYFNLVKQKGKQYTLSLFVSTLLVAITVFGISFNSVTFIQSSYEAENASYDYTLLVSSREAGDVTADTIRQLGLEYNVSFTSFTELEFLLLSREMGEFGRPGNEWSGELATSESMFNRLVQNAVNVAPGTYIPFCEDLGYSNPDAVFNGYYTRFTNPDITGDIHLEPAKGYLGKGIVNSMADPKRFVVLNDADYAELASQITDRYKMQFYLINTDEANVDGELAFHRALVDAMVDAGDGMIWENVMDAAALEEQYEAGQIDVPQDKLIPYEGNELLAVRQWPSYPFSRQSAKAGVMESGAVYILLISFAALIAFIAATMIIGIKILSTLWQDKENYRKASFLGLKRKSLNGLITGQIALMFFFPAICGCGTAVLLIQQMINASSVTQIGAVTFSTLLLSLALCVIQVVIFFFIRRAAIRKYGQVQLG